MDSLTPRRAQACRASALAVLHQVSPSVSAPIDLEVIAKTLDLRVFMFRGEVHTDGRLVALPGKGGTIRLRPGQDLTRLRFTAAHEIGHYQLHCQTPNCISDGNLSDLLSNSTTEQETEADVFASELLMPQHLFAPLLKDKTPSLALIDSLAGTFKTGFLATLRQFWSYTDQQVALVFSSDGRIERFDPFRLRSLRVRLGEIHSQSLAHKLTEKGCSGMHRVPIEVWLSHHGSRQQELWEDSRHLDSYKMTVTLLWIKGA